MSSILAAGVAYYYFKNKSLKKRYQVIDNNTVSRKQMDSVLLHPTL